MLILDNLLRVPDEILHQLAPPLVQPSVRLPSSFHDDDLHALGPGGMSDELIRREGTPEFGLMAVSDDRLERWQAW